jgi:hypothetical protein
MDKILQMLQLQQQLNDATNGEGWEKGVTKNGKLIDWKRCSYLECAELIESYPWKHWKNIDAQPDYGLQILTIFPTFKLFMKILHLQQKIIMNR